MSLRFEWDEEKNRSNQRKHGVSFEEAAQVFRDPLHLSVPERIENEQRWQTFGLSGGIVLLMVAHTLTEEDAEGQFCRSHSDHFSPTSHRRGTQTL